MSKLQQLQEEYQAKLESMTIQATENLAVARLEGKIKLVSDEAYVSARIRRQHKTENLLHLQTLLIQINSLPEIKITGSSDSFRMRAYPLGESQFGAELSALIGLITSAQSAYVDEHKEAVQAILGCTMIDLESTIMAFGKTSYYSKNTNIVVDGIQGNYELAKIALEDISEMLNLPHPLDMSAFTEQAYSNYFANASRKAQAKLEEFNRSLAIDANNQFTLTTIGA